MATLSFLSIKNSLKTDLAMAGLIFVLVLQVYLASPMVTSTDSKWTIPLGMSIIKEGNTNLDEYLTEELAQTDYRIEKVGDHYYSYFPIGTALLAAPILAITVLFDHLLWNDLSQEKTPAAQATAALMLEMAIASIFTALTTIFLYFSARTRLFYFSSAIIALTFAFGTSAWSIASRALWQHTPSMFMLTLTLYLILLSEKKNKPFLLQYTAIPLALAFIIRPSNAIPILFISTYIALISPRAFLRYFLIASPFAAAFMLYNFSIYGAPISPYYNPERVFHWESFSEALAGNLLSPARGLLIYSPILILGGIGLAKLSAQPKTQRLAFTLGGILIGHWLLISSFPHWWGGHTFGPRLFSDVLPIFAVLSCFAIEDMLKLEKKQKALALFAITPLLLFSFFTHHSGATSINTHWWNTLPNNIDENPNRLWDWQDPAFLRDYQDSNTYRYAFIIKTQERTEVSLLEILKTYNREDFAIILTFKGDGETRIPQDFAAQLTKRNGNLARVMKEGSYAAILANDELIFESFNNQGAATVQAHTNKYDIFVVSTGPTYGNQSKIKINQVELSPNRPGFNFVILDMKNDQVWQYSFPLTPH